MEIYHAGWLFDAGEGSIPSRHFVLTETNTLSNDGNTLTGTHDFKQFDNRNHPISAGEVRGRLKDSRIDFDHPFEPITP